MKIRFGALALVAMLAACSSQDQTETGVRASKGNASTTSPEKGAAISGYSNDSKRTLGSAPDRGELFGYKKGAAVLHKGAYTLRPIALSEEHAIRGVATGMMTLPGPNGEQIKIRYQRHEENPDGNWSWIGRVVGGDAGREAIITFGEHAVFGTIPQAKGPSLQLTTERGIAYLVQADASRLVKGVRAGGDTRVAASYAASNSNEVDSLVASATKKVQAQASAGSSKAVTAANTVDLVAGYSNGLATRLGGTSAAITKLVNLVAAANAALTNSNVNGKIRLVNALQVSYADNTDNGTALNELTGNNGTGPVTVPASLAPLRAARETYGADLVTLVRDFKSENNGCGIAWLLGANQAPITIPGDAPFAYSVISEGSYDLSGSTYYCEDITLAHEMAHNMGSAHDLGNAGSNSGRYPYSYGYKTAAAQGNFFTVMAYGDNNQTLYRVFSNPLITTCGGLACGVANQADNARSLNQTIPIVATFRATIVPITGLKVRSDFNGDGLSDIIWTSTTSQQASRWYMNGPFLAGGQADAMPAGYRVIGVGDFDGDNRSDLLWANAANTSLVMWRPNAGNQFVGSVVGAYPAGDWTVAGIGDMNGDGRDDIVWTSAATQQVSRWYMNGPALIGGQADAAPAGYRVVGMGDFDGDGRSDLLWANAGNTGLVMWRPNSNNQFVGAHIGAYPAGNWTVAGIGDMNGDGYADVVWTNPTTQQTSRWYMNGTSLIGGQADAMPSGYNVVGVGDFDGDNRSDLLWTNAAKTGVVMWRPNASNQYVGNFVANYPAGNWTIVMGTY